MTMYQLRPSGVYVLDRVLADTRAALRMERMLAGIGLAPRDAQVISDQDLPELIDERGWGRAWTLRQGHGDPMAPRDLVFNAFNFDGPHERVDQVLERCPPNTSRHVVQSLMGFMTPVLSAHPRRVDQQRDVVCWSAREFCTIEGCPHGCKYCSAGQLINVMVNLEELADRVIRPTLAEHASQKCFRCNTTLSDTICFEPEYGLHEVLLPVFAEFPDRYLYIHTSSANVDFVASVPDRNRLICIWSITADEVAELVEPGAASGSARIEAARKCQELGLPVRFKLKPIVPIRGWRQYYAATIERMFKLTRPEMVGFCVLMWMRVEELRQLFGDVIEPEYLRAAEECAEEMTGKPTGPFPPHVRAEIYRFLIEQVRRWDEQVPLFLSTESRELWNELAPSLGTQPQRFFCGCGAICVPGPRLLGPRTSTYVPEEQIDEPGASAGA